MRTHPHRRRAEPLAVQLLAARDDAGEPLPLPPLFPASTPAQDRLHDRIYHLVALALRAYMQTWYGRIAPRDAQLLPTVNRDIVVPLLSPLLSPLTTDEGRERLADLLLLHAPILLATHVRTYWAARADIFTPLPAAYHARLPTLVAADVGGTGTYVLNPAYTAALVDALLAARLPEKDYGSCAERLVVREVLGRAVFGAIGKRLSAAWFYAELGIKFLPQPSRKPRPGRTVLGTLHGTYKAIVSVFTIIYALGTWLVAFLSASSPPKAKYTRVADGPLALLSALAGTDGRSGLSAPSWPLRAAFSSLELSATLLAPVTDRVLPSLLMAALNADTGLRVAALLERILFPDGWPGPPLIEPSPEEAAALDARLRERVGEALPVSVKWAISPLPGATVADALVDVISEPGCNAHLVGMLLNAIVGALVPELVAEDSPASETGEEKADAVIASEIKDAVETKVTERSVESGVAAPVADPLDAGSE